MTVEKNTALPTPTTKKLIQILLITIYNIGNSLPIARYTHAPLPWALSKCISLARVLQRMANLLKQQPLDNVSLQEVSIIP